MTRIYQNLDESGITRDLVEVNRELGMTMAWIIMFMAFLLGMCIMVNMVKLYD